MKANPARWRELINCADGIRAVAFRSNPEIFIADAFMEGRPDSEKARVQKLISCARYLDEMIDWVIKDCATSKPAKASEAIKILLLFKEGIGDFYRGIKEVASEDKAKTAVDSLLKKSHDIYFKSLVDLGYEIHAEAEIAGATFTDDRGGSLATFLPNTEFGLLTGIHDGNVSRMKRSGTAITLEEARSRRSKTNRRSDAKESEQSVKRKFDSLICHC